ncbi:DNA repair protein RecN [Patiriisocius hiemis]|uniref:DNA repair protein RecN n=1 Tax=Patiriisocius hiemis TaxID=3075604 RepID=A0ABU2YAD3_9FLAO|nr:DNA repair protein RecN [Constantimarinum sp. W242]MDT0555157.1 DNA repair protein RecN [Constantimarinum sp. W242]
MITSLSIKNYALIEDIQVNLKPGMTIITGETGAGKSILLGALSLLLGKRADLSSVKDSSKKCTIEGEFSINTYNLQSLFEENDLDYESHTILRREILPSGKSRAFINDTPVSLAQMQALGIHLVDIHSQHETLSITSEAYQLDVIDALARNQSLLIGYSEKLNEYTSLSEKLSQLQTTKSEATKELDYNTFLHKELDEAQLDGLNLKELEETYETLNNAEEIEASLSQVISVLGQEQIGSLETIKEIRSLLSKLKNFKASYAELWERFNSVVIELEDLETTLEEEVGTIEADPQQLYAANEKLQTVYKLQQKHNLATIEELIHLRDDLASKIDVTLHIDDEIETIKNTLEKVKKETQTIGEKISKARKEATPKLKQELETILTSLGLPNAQFQFDITPSETFRKNGTDVLTLLFSANKGGTLGSLKKVASGGEMSRIMLAVKAVLSSYKKLPTIIFDEIDTGVSGEVALKIADIMAVMGNTMQLLSITHLPQIASKGEHHIKVYKEDTAQSTVTYLKELTFDERLVEIAQMIGGKNITDATLANARELLN